MSDNMENTGSENSKKYDDVGAEYSEEEIEVTDDSGEEEEAKLPLDQKPKPAKSSPGTGRVQPSEKVRNMEMGTPESLSKKAKFSPEKNPFPAHGEWNKASLSQIEISFPILTGKNETTNELTRSTKPEARYWRAPITFKYANFTSETIRFDNVHIPFHTGKGYGDNYVYMVLPIAAANAFGEAGKKNAPTKVVENSLLPDSARWWKIANKVEGLFGIVNNETRKFHSKSLSTIFDATQSGVSCSVILKFSCKASTTEKEPLRATTPRTISCDIVRAYITGTDINVDMPTRVSRERAKVEPTATKRDVASDDLMERLSQMGL